jgi:phytoene synthase
MTHEMTAVGSPPLLPPVSRLPSPVSCLLSSSAYCRRITRRSRSSFAFAFRLLPPDQRDAITGLYAFLRVTDDLTDEPGEVPAKRAALRRWRTRLDDALAGTFTHRCHAALHHAVITFGIPTAYLHAVLDGCECDLEPVQLQSFDQLRTYCYRVASAVGLACVRIWGLRPGATFEQAEPFAEAAGYAFQLTNVLRDLSEDLARGRVYLPADELARFDCQADAWRMKHDRFRELLQFQVDRARQYYRESEPLADLLAPAGRTVFTLMRDAYRGLLDRVEAAGAGVLARRVRLSRWQKLRLLARAGWPFCSH